MTFFNDPVLQPDHAARAVGLAVAMRDHFAALSADWRRRGHVLEIGIGIATGYATLGRIGFEGRYDYGAVGPRDHPRGPAQRRGGAGRDPHRQPDLRRRRGRRSTPTPAGDRQLKGFSRPVPVYAVAGMQQEGRPT